MQNTFADGLRLNFGRRCLTTNNNNNSGENWQRCSLAALATFGGTVAISRSRTFDVLNRPRYILVLLLLFFCADPRVCGTRWGHSGSAKTTWGSRRSGTGAGGGREGQGIGRTARFGRVSTADRVNQNTVEQSVCCGCEFKVKIVFVSA
ncbi:hypothetical protein GWI33_018113 [Rhynchophorus ferrugineus]|uniref:Uncharacterized protein n=1 Tax=Rhynchophorus ferrugineus TaxID=354439 RepID=A0A834HX18_RHYFE|nr:hypothetical protein GWI33_018113 [Rhynchophorus ferrugineus]